MTDQVIVLMVDDRLIPVGVGHVWAWRWAA